MRRRAGRVALLRRHRPRHRYPARRDRPRAQAAAPRRLRARSIVGNCLTLPGALPGRGALLLAVRHPARAGVRGDRRVRRSSPRAPRRPPRTGPGERRAAPRRRAAGAGPRSPAGGATPATASAPEEAPPPVHCEVCGAELEHDQTYCLECGAPHPLAPRLRRGGRARRCSPGRSVNPRGRRRGARVRRRERRRRLGGGRDRGDDRHRARHRRNGHPAADHGPAGDIITAAPTAPATTAPGTGPGSRPSPARPRRRRARPRRPRPSPRCQPPEAEGAARTGRPAETAWTALLSSVRSESDARAAKARLASSGRPAGRSLLLRPPRAAPRLLESSSRGATPASPRPRPRRAS